ncbi:YnfA family protein [Planococcus sp. 1R117A]|uniref:YnfA family protein n=1 Tax=Planococcus sp. 1R117A TaxID=3447020 RepID=UPI003EDCA400
MIYTIFLFVIAGIDGIVGVDLIWLLLREGKSLRLGIFGVIELALYGVIATFQSFASFDRIYAAYGRAFIILTILWGWEMDNKIPDLYGWIGATRLKNSY